jgi:FkbM family methyltransferase
MNLEKFVWQQLRLLNLIPGARFLFYLIANMMYKDHSVIKIPFGPAANFMWRHHQIYQPWMTLGIYEPEVAKLIQESLYPGDVFYDIGAHAGYFTLIAANNVGPTGLVIAFEPLPANTNTINQQIKLNGLQAICRVVTSAVMDTMGEVSLIIPKRIANAHLLDVPAPHVNEGRGKVIRVSSITLDSFVSDNPWPTLIKMDIEGAELKALMGAKELLSSPKAPVFLITAHSEKLNREVRDMLSNYLYEFSNFPYMIHAIPMRRKREDV